MTDIVKHILLLLENESDEVMPVSLKLLIYDIKIMHSTYWIHKSSYKKYITISETNQKFSNHECRILLLLFVFAF